MKRILSLILCLVTVFSLAGCKDEKKTEEPATTTSKIDIEPKKDGLLYSSLKLEDYVKIGAYKGIAVDTSSADFKKYYDSVIESDVSNNDFYKKNTNGKVKDGDVANIDYVGKMDGKAFEGGSYEGYDLTIGSGSFIPGFETALIGKSIGKTYDIDLTFPEDYGNEELNGKDVVFTVTINYVKTETALKPSDYYKKLGFKTLKEYEDSTKESAIKNYLLDKVLSVSVTVKYPENELKYLTACYMKMMSDQITAQYNTSLEDYLATMNADPTEYTESIKTEQIQPTMDRQMVIYGILQKEKKEVTVEEVNAKIDEAVKENVNNMTAEDLKNYFGEYYFEYLVALDKALDIIYSNAKIS